MKQPVASRLMRAVTALKEQVDVTRQSIDNEIEALDREIAERLTSLIAVRNGQKQSVISAALTRRRDVGCLQTQIQQERLRLARLEKALQRTTRKK